jgi:hypothetical protein
MSKLAKQQKEARKILYEDVSNNWPLRRGKNEFLKSLASENVTRGDAILAQCYHCCGGYESGVADCRESICPLYKFMPYRDEQERTAMPEEQKAQLIARFKAGRERKAGENATGN